MTDKNIREQILLSALNHAVFDGWNDELLKKAGDECSIETHALFPNGVFDLICYFSDWADQEMLKQMKEANLKDMRIRDKITFGVRTRLEIMAPYKQAFQDSVRYMSIPPRSFYLPKLVWKTADKIWWAAGDKSTDYNHYTKRSLLSGVITATTLFWFNDKSENNERTWDFLDKRIENVLKIGQFIGKAKRKA